jgi:hypothetical protein
MCSRWVQRRGVRDAQHLCGEGWGRQRGTGGGAGTREPGEVRGGGAGARAGNKGRQSGREQGRARDGERERERILLWQRQQPDFPFARPEKERPSDFPSSPTSFSLKVRQRSDFPFARPVPPDSAMTAPFHGEIMSPSRARWPWDGPGQPGEFGR